MTEIVRPAGAQRIRIRIRIDLIDILRAIALIAMASYHFTWDLDHFGYVERGMANTGGWRLYARCIASSFLFLVGVSLVLAQGRGIRWRSFGKREAQVAAGALAITVVTFFATPGSFVFFGILHQIAVASLIGLAFVRLPAFAAILAGAACIALPFLFSTTFTEPRWLAWIGLAARQPVTNDYVPIFPWTGVVLLGIAAALLLERIDAWRRLASLNARLTKLRPLAALGRHSLLFYLLHQPILFGLVAGLAYFHPPDRTAEFTEDCVSECVGEAAACAAACACVGDRLKAEKLLQPLLDRSLSAAGVDRLNDAVRECRLPLRPAVP